MIFCGTFTPPAAPSTEDDRLFTPFIVTVLVALLSPSPVALLVVRVDPAVRFHGLEYAMLSPVRLKMPPLFAIATVTTLLSFPAMVSVPVVLLLVIVPA